MRSLVILLAVASIPVSATQAQRRGSDRDDRCDTYNFGNRSRARHCEARQVSLGASGGAITVEGGLNGGVEVLGWDRDSVEVIAYIETNARNPEEAREIAEEIRIVVSGRELRVEGPRIGRGVSWSVSYEMRVPRHSDLSLTTSNGPVQVEDVSGSMQLESENGPITLIGVGGDVRARATNGPLDVQLAGARWEGAGLDAETVNGPVSLDIPAGYSARLETGTINGPFDTETPLTVTFMGRSRSRISSVLGSGGAPVRAVTTNGPVQIRKG
jgi:hypothetical protein